jgi:hypothetical protein
LDRAKAPAATPCWSGGTGTGKTHLAIAIARSCIRGGARGRFYNVVDLVNRLETEARPARPGRLADHLTRMDFVILDELGYLPFAQSGGQTAEPTPRRRPWSLTALQAESGSSRFPPCRDGSTAYPEKLSLTSPHPYDAADHARDG